MRAPWRRQHRARRGGEAGTWHEISVGDLVHLIAELMGVEVEIETDSSRLRPADSEVERLLASTEKAKRLTGWEATYAGREGLRAGLTEAIAGSPNRPTSRVTVSGSTRSGSAARTERRRYH